MEKLVKIVLSPFNPSLEVAGGIVINAHVPYSDKEITVQVNPSIQDYKEHQDSPEVQIKQVMTTTTTDQTKTLKFDFQENNSHEIEIDDKKYEIKFTRTGFPIFWVSG